jgi:hypothetical protein
MNESNMIDGQGRTVSVIGETIHDVTVKDQDRLRDMSSHSVES